MNLKDERWQSLSEYLRCEAHTFDFASDVVRETAVKLCVDSYASSIHRELREIFRDVYFKGDPL